MHCQQTITYHELMEKLVCSVESKLCMIHRCPSCPGALVLASFLEAVCKIDDFNAGEVLKYKQWVTTDRTTLQDCCMTLEEFVETLVERVDKLTSRHFTAKHQSQYLAKLKENLTQ